jgi:hypothetical protein
MISPVAHMASFRGGYAKSASESAFPSLWRGLRGAWEFGIQEDGNRIYDLTRRWDVGTFNSAPAWNVSDLGRSLDFDGTDDYVSVSDFSWEASSPITVVTSILVLTGEVQGGSGFGVGTNGTDGTKFQAHLPWSDSNVYWDYGRTELAGTSFTSHLDKWTNVTLTADATGAQQVWFDGIVAQTISSSAAPSAVSDLSIGRANIGSDFFFQGRIRHFRIYDRALTPNEIMLSVMFPEGPFISARRLVSMASLGVSFKHLALLGVGR